MPTSDDLLGLGLSSPVADALGNQPTSLACTGTAQATGATIKSTLVELVPSTSNTGAVLSANAKVGSAVYAFNAQSTSALIYPPSGGYINNSLNFAFTLAQNKSVMLMQYKTIGTADYWSANLTA